jgi:hypothetical protein
MVNTTPIPATTTTTTSTSPPLYTTTQQPNIFNASGLKRVYSLSLSDSWNGYGVSPSGSGITDFISTGSYVHYQLPSGANAVAVTINPNNLLKYSESRFELYDTKSRSSGILSITTTTTTTSAPVTPAISMPQASVFAPSVKISTRTITSTSTTNASNPNGGQSVTTTTYQPTTTPSTHFILIESAPISSPNIIQSSDLYSTSNGYHSEFVGRDGRVFRITNRSSDKLYVHVSISCSLANRFIVMYPGQLVILQQALSQSFNYSCQYVISWSSTSPQGSSV